MRRLPTLHMKDEPAVLPDLAIRRQSHYLRVIYRPRTRYLHSTLTVSLCPFNKILVRILPIVDHFLPNSFYARFASYATVDAEQSEILIVLIALYNVPQKDGFSDMNSGNDLITSFFSGHPVYLKLFSFVGGR